jgi:hypothetical protein
LGRAEQRRSREAAEEQVGLKRAALHLADLHAHGTPGNERGNVSLHRSRGALGEHLHVGWNLQLRQADSMNRRDANHFDGLLIAWGLRGLRRRCLV